ncbi:MAG: acyltransferase, partial [Chloroflexi bacterium]|nr:acyltransferase [Chloroflexota bacterium]
MSFALGQRDGSEADVSPHRPSPANMRPTSAPPAPRIAARAARAEAIRWAHRPDIEGLRAVAVGLVLLFHASIGPFSGGFVGVDVFFVLSGYLITGLLLRELAQTGTISLATFYARRARRLLPAALLVLLATMIGSALWLPPLLVAGVAGDVAAAAAYVSNLGFAAQATDYFAATQPPSPVLHCWSLGVEEQFYVFWPAILLLVARVAHGRERRVALAVLGISGGSFLLSLWLTLASAPWAFFSLPTRAWELGLGAILAVAGWRLARIPGPLAALAAWTGLALIVAAGVLFTEATPFPGLAALLPTLGAALVVAGGARESKLGPTAILSSAVPRFLGRISYSLYLWHWPVLVIPAVATGAPLPPAARLGLVGVTVLLAAATHRVVEDPIRRGRLVGTRPPRNLALAGALTVAVAVIAVGIGATTTVGPTESTGTTDVAASERTIDEALGALLPAEDGEIGSDPPPLTGAPGNVPLAPGSAAGVSAPDDEPPGGPPAPPVSALAGP